MTYFRCNCCGAVFSEDNAGSVYVEDGYGSKEMVGCPECHTSDISESDRCEICGAPIETGYYCNDCKWEMKKIWEVAVESVMGIRTSRGVDVDEDYCDCEQAMCDYLERAVY